MTTELASAQKVMKRWKMHRNALLELVAVLPESGGSWRPWDGAMTTVELVHHLAMTPDFFFSAIEERDMIVPPVPSTLAEARELLNRLTEEHERKLASYTEADLRLEATIPAFRVTEPIEEVLHRLIGHEAHHKGQLFVYVRMLGAVPPFYTDLTV
ncbi:DinB family protein [Paenibacillus glycinis]|uniref:DinB family protein n=1 Tax=Paenibacillus glycinis TaxID=2697035 RepID=A0ABW9XQB1_9BACL|nr:DinB family protein [Paenibacillus glycinis]NBD24823.1 DinB family protein [Paenibacillus glycinis]